MSYDLPPVPLEQLHRQLLKNHVYALTVLERLPELQAAPLREELAELMLRITAAYAAGDAAEHYRLDQQLFFQFLLRLDFALKAATKTPGRI